MGEPRVIARGFHPFPGLESAYFKKSPQKAVLYLHISTNNRFYLE